MTLEKAAELVSAMRAVGGLAAAELFMYFDDLFHLSDQDEDGTAVSNFAVMCGLGTVADVRPA